MLKVYGLDKLNKNLAKYGNGIGPMLERTTKEAVLFVHSRIPDYPPAPPDSSYRRTMTLWRSITSLQGSAPFALARVEAMFGYVKGIVGTALSYAPWVIDEDSQTAFHAITGWWTLQGVVSGLQGEIVKVFEKGVREYTRSIFRP